MKVLIVNPIIYTSETPTIKKVTSIKDTMIYDLCLGFIKGGNDVTLVAGEPYKPTLDEEYPFDVIWAKCKCQKLFKPNVLPYCPEIKDIAKKGNFDLIISSEVFSVNSLSLALYHSKSTIIWHELAQHNHIMHGIPSHIWYGVIARLFFKKVTIVPRSTNAKDFISKYCKNVTDTVIDHGVNLDKFILNTNKKNQFAVPSQLIKRKRIDGIIKNFASYLKEYDSTAKLYIMGEGEEKDNLISLSKNLNVDKSVIFTGKLPHNELTPILSQSIAMLVNTEKDCNMVSIVEAIACATPIITTPVPYSTSYIKSHRLGIAKDNWSADDMYKVAKNNEYINNCIAYRNKLSTKSKADAFINIAKSRGNDKN